MTKYVVNGGMVPIDKGGLEFYQEILAGNKNMRLLVVPFAESAERHWWMQVYDRHYNRLHYKGIFKKYFQLDPPLVIARRPHFLGQIKWANTIYFEGGTSWRIIRALAQYDGWQDMLDDKVIAGTSAGTNALFKHCYGLDDDKPFTPNGPLNGKVIVHWASDYGYRTKKDWAEVRKKMEKLDPALPLITLREGQTLVLDLP